MVRINKVYTKMGDAGDTVLAGGQRLRKNAARIAAYGTVDELNATLGMAAEACRGVVAGPLQEWLGWLLRIQNELFDLGAQLAVLRADRRPDTPLIRDADVERLEGEIDAMNDALPPLKSFILPGGGEVSARLHLARTVCRRAERELVTLMASEAIDGPELRYLNRLSDWLFVAARHAAAAAQVPETLWKPGNR